MTNKEENNYPLAVAISAGIMAVLIAISFIIAIGNFEPEELGMGGMVVNYGTSETGIGDDYTSIEEPSVDPNANNQRPDKVTPEQTVTPNQSSQSTDKEIQTQDMEDAVAINTKPQKSTANPTAKADDKPEKPAINQNALYKGKKKDGSGGGDGEGGEPGNQGSINGDPLAPNYGEGGSGNGSTPLPLARFNGIKAIDDDGQKTGKIAVAIQVNAQGQVVKATAGARGTTFIDQALFRKCEQAVMGASLDKMTAGYEKRKFTVVFNFRVR